MVFLLTLMDINWTPQLLIVSLLLFLSPKSLFLTTRHAHPPSTFLSLVSLSKNTLFFWVILHYCLPVFFFSSSNCFSEKPLLWDVLIGCSSGLFLVNGLKLKLEWNDLKLYFFEFNAVRSDVGYTHLLEQNNEPFFFLSWLEMQV